ncbi:MAG: L,D-transpeptidase [Treponemataceae bacterium]
MKKFCIIFSAFLFCLVAFSQEAFASDTDTTVIVSINSQRTYVYQNGELTRTFICSTGLLDGDSDTPLGDYIINESGQKRGTWFYSKTYGAGGKYWLGFIGGIYLFHSVPMDENQNIMQEEAAKLGETASHGCIRLSVDDSYWIYKNVPDKSDLHIVKSFFPEKLLKDCKNYKEIPIPKQDMFVWFSANGKDYKQKYKLSCEIALIRAVASLCGITSCTEDSILDFIPKGTNPQTSFVMEDINAGRKNEDGSINWNNYGTHSPVVVSAIQTLLKQNGKAETFSVREEKLTDERLFELIKTDTKFFGAIVWLEGHPERWGKNPKINERGMVAGEHVRFVLPVLTKDDKFLLYDPETGKVTSSKNTGDCRECFDFATVTIRQTRKIK